jgi:hypothetical protein
MAHLRNGDSLAASKDVRPKYHSTSVNHPDVVRGLGFEPGNSFFLADATAKMEKRLKDLIRELTDPHQSRGAFTSGEYRTTGLRSATAAVRLRLMCIVLQCCCKSNIQCVCDESVDAGGVALIAGLVYEVDLTAQDLKYAMRCRARRRISLNCC